MVKKFFCQLMMAAIILVSGYTAAEAEDVWAYSAPDKEFSIYVISESVSMTPDNTIKCRTKAVSGEGTDITGWEFTKKDDKYFYRVCESEGDNGLVAVEGPWYDLNSKEMASVLVTSVNCMK